MPPSPRPCPEGGGSRPFATLEEQGYRVIRFLNADGHHHLNTVLESIRSACEAAHPSSSA
jgi:very-short-patch-repair endonuclease